MMYFPTGAIAASPIKAPPAPQQLARNNQRFTALSMITVTVGSRLRPIRPIVLAMLSGASWSVAHPIIVRFATGPSSCGQTGALFVPDRSLLLALAVALLALMTGASNLGAQQNGTGPAGFGNSLPAANRPSAGLSFTNEPY